MLFVFKYFATYPINKQCFPYFMGIILLNITESVVLVLCIACQTIKTERKKVQSCLVNSML